MPKGPQGQKRPADVIGAAIKVAKIATGEIEEDNRKDECKDAAAVSLGKRGGKARAEALSPEERREGRKGRSASSMEKKALSRYLLTLVIPHVRHRFTLGDVIREIHNHLNRLFLRSIVVVVVDVGFQLATVTHNLLATLRERPLHMFAICDVNVVPKVQRLAIPQHLCGMPRTIAATLGVRPIFFSRCSR